MIYGAGKTVGRAFAKHLAQRGFGLILIDYSYESLRETENYLRDTLPSVQLLIKMIVLKNEMLASE